MKRILCAALLAVAGCNGMGNKGGGNNGGSAPSGGPVTLDTDDQKTLYALGLALAKNTAVFGLSPADAQYVMAGFNDAISGAKPQVEFEQYGPKIQQLAQTRMRAKADAEKQKGQATIDAAAAAPGAQKLPSGMVYHSVSPGNGPSPQATDTVKVNYEGKLADGKVFDSSYKRGQPATFPLRGVVPCWTEGLQHMKVGEKAELTCPSNLAYGDMGKPPDIPGGATLIFTVELLEIMPPSAQPAPGMPMPGQAAPGMPAPSTGGSMGGMRPPMNHPPMNGGHPGNPPGKPGMPPPGNRPGTPPPPPGKGGPTHH